MEEVHDLASPLSNFLYRRRHPVLHQGSARSMRWVRLEMWPDELRTGNVRRVSVNSAGSFVLLSL